MRLFRPSIVAGALLAIAVGGASAQGFPSKPARILVGFAPGGNTDLVARIFAQRLGELWNQPVIVDNRTGASGMIAAEVVAKAAPDGYTLLLTPQTSIAVAPALLGRAPYDPAKDFTPITLAGSSPLLMVVHPSFPAKTFADFVALAKKGGGNPLTFGSGGIGSSPHMAGELLAAALGIRMNHVPYKGEIPALTDTMGGQIPIMFGNLPVAVPFVQSGKLRALANTASTRSPLAPAIPTVAESGIKEYSIATWSAVLGPAGMAPELATRVQRDIVRVMSQPDTRDRLVSMGVDIIGSSPEDFGAFLRAEIVRFARLIKDAGIKAD